MTSTLKSLEMHFPESDYGLSARRLWEYTELGQINVFSQAISARRELNDAAAFIDIVRLDGDTFSLTGVKLAELNAGCIPANCSPQQIAVLLDCVKAKDGVAFVSAVANHLESCAMRQAVRNQQHQFLPSAQADDVFGVPYIFSTLRRRLQSMGKSKAGAEQWLKTIENFQKKGLRAEEFECSGLLPDLSPPYDDTEQFTALEMADLCDFKRLRLSVIPVVTEAQRQLRFVNPPKRKLNRIKNLPKALEGLPRAVAEFDPVLGYRIEQVEHQTLWGRSTTGRR